MALQTGGEISVDKDCAATFDFIGDPVRLAQCIPGCRDLQQLSPDRYSAVLTTEVAFITLNFKVTVQILRIDPPKAIEAKITGDGIGIAGRVAASAGIQLSEVAPGRTNIRYTANVGLTGKLGGLGEPVFRAKSAEVAREFGANLKAAIERTAKSNG